ncbi:sugar phosphate nucleotidyltransferase [Candidatus Pelagibacter ubique]|nr:sugar phosphate nucleotidyltransferase [Candidatus Pelagibacter ubique]
MQLVIFAGGLGTRISEETDYVPKPMVKIGKKPILWHIIKYYSVFGFSEFIICGGYKISIIKNYFKKSKNHRSWNIKVINTGKASNTGERLKRIKKYINGSFCLTYGDGLSNVNIDKLINFHEKNKPIVTLTTIKPQPLFGRLIFKGNKVIKFLEKEQKKESWINGGFFVCEKKIFNHLNKKNTIFEKDTLSSLAMKKELIAYKHRDFWYCMDTLRDKRHLNSLWFSKKAPWKIWKDE